MIPASGAYITVSVDPDGVLYWYDLVKTPVVPGALPWMAPAEELAPSPDNSGDGKILPPYVDVLTVESTNDPKCSGLTPESPECTLITLGVPSPVLPFVRGLLALLAPLSSLL